MSHSENHHRLAGVAAILAIALTLAACGVGGMTRAVTTAGEGFERGECLSEQFRTGDPCDQDQFSQD